MAPLGALILGVLILLILNAVKTVASFYGDDESLDCRPGGAELARAAGFFFVCVPLRMLLAAYSPHLPAEVFAIGAMGFLGSYLSGSRVGFFGGTAWWRDIRPLHALMYAAAFAAKSAGGDPAPALYIDIFIGLASRLFLA